MNIIIKIIFLFDLIVSISFVLYIIYSIKILIILETFLDCFSNICFEFFYGNFWKIDILVSYFVHIIKHMFYKNTLKNIFLQK